MVISVNSQIGMKDWKKVHIREDGDFKKPRVAKCSSDQEVVDLLSSARWEHVKMGLMEAGMGKRESLLHAIAYLAKHGWNDNQKYLFEARNEQFRNVDARLVLERLEQEGKVGRSTITLLIPAAVMNAIRDSGDPIKTAQGWRERLESYDGAERAVVRRRAMEALAEIGTPSALAELGKLLLCKSDNKDLWAASILGRAARERPAEVVPILRKMAAELAAKPEYGEEEAVLKRICEVAENAGV